MPAMANITVKNNANADVVYVAKTPSAGDRVAARWMADAVQAIIGQRPTVTVVTRDNGQKNGRIMEVNGAFPIVQTINTIPTVVSVFPMKASFTLPTNVDSASVRDAYVQMTNIMVSALFRDIAETGFAAT